MPFTEAVDFLKSKVPMTKDEWNALNRKLQFRAFTMAKLGTATEIETAKQILADAVEKGETYAESWQTLKDSLGGNPSFKPGYWETVFRTNTQSAYMAGKLAKYADTGAVAYQLLVIEDERTSKICRHLLVESGYGAILPVGHRFWQKYGFPPYHFNCRTSVCPIYSSQVAKTGYIVEDIPMNRFSKFKPQKGFGGNPLERGNWWDMTDSMKKQAVKFGLMEKFEKMFRTSSFNSEKSLEILNNQEKVNPSQFSKVRKRLIELGYTVQCDVETDKLLEHWGKEAFVMPTNDGKAIIFYHTKTSASGMFEELIHLTQLKKIDIKTGVDKAQKLLICKNEIDAKKKLLKNTDAYGITNYEVGVIKDSINYYEKIILELTNEI